jgi:hypothetical protein
MLRLPRLVGLGCLILVALLAAGCNREESQLPLPLDQLIPTTCRIYTPEEAKQSLHPLSIDEDPESEWLLFFYFDNVLPDGANGPIGGVIYDAQQNTTEYDPQSIIPFPYQPSAFLVPYRLLPDWRANKGQGYLGNAAVTFELTSFNPARDAEDTVYSELVVFGQVAGGVVTRLSIFKWNSQPIGYDVAYFTGSYSVDTGARDPDAVVRDITTLDRLNERSNLCKRTIYQRQGNSFSFPVVSQSTIVFCQGTPTAPTYPEAVVLAWLLPDYPGTKADLVAPEQLSAVTQASPIAGRILGLTYDSTARSEGLGTDAVSRMIVTTTIVDEAQVQRVYEWTLQEKKPTQVSETARWLITQVTPVP